VARGTFVIPCLQAREAHLPVPITWLNARLRYGSGKCSQSGNIAINGIHPFQFEPGTTVKEISQDAAEVRVVMTLSLENRIRAWLDVDNENDVTANETVL